jgi:gluconolactonase
MSLMALSLIVLLTACLSLVQAFAQERLYEATPLTAEKSFTGEIEGPAVDKDGTIYAVSFARKPTIGRVSPDGKAELFLEMPNGSLGNGIRFDRDGRMYVADYTNHNILLVNTKSRKVKVFAHNEALNQPNDLAITADGNFYASDPNWGKGTGQIWFVDRKLKEFRVVAKDMGTTNGIDLSPDGKTLYVNESVQRNIWAFRVLPGGSLTDKRLLIQFPDFGFDGMRCDVKGNLYATRHGKGVVAKISPEGKVLREIPVLGMKPSNICFGGKDGRTAYVTEMEKGRLVQFRVEDPGIEWTRWPGRSQVR